MAIQTIPGGLWIPAPWYISIAAFSSLLCDASTEKVAFIVHAPKAGTLDKFEWRTGAVANNPDNGVRCSFQGLSAGLPDGVDDQRRDITGTLSANTWQVPGLMTSDGTDGGSKRTVTMGEPFACVIKYVSFVASDSFNVSSQSLTSGTGLSTPYVCQDTGGGFTKVTSSNPVMALKYDDGAYYFIGNTVYPIIAFNNQDYNAGSTPDERGMIFSFPFPVRVSGAWVYFAPQVNAANADLNIYDSDGTTVLGTFLLDEDVQSASVIRTCFFDSPVNLAANTNYRLVVKPTTANTVRIRDIDVNSAALMDCVEGGQNWHYTQRTDAGAWSQTTTKRPWIGLLVSGFDDAASIGFYPRRQIYA